MPPDLFQLDAGDDWAPAPRIPTPLPLDIATTLINSLANGAIAVAALSLTRATTFVTNPVTLLAAGAPWVAMLVHRFS